MPLSVPKALSSFSLESCAKVVARVSLSLPTMRLLMSDQNLLPVASLDRKPSVAEAT